MQAMEQIFVDKIFIGVNGIDAARGLTTFHPEEATKDLVMIRQAKRKIVVADHGKLGVVTGLPRHRSSHDHHRHRATDGMIEPFLDLGIEVRRV